MPPGKMMLDIQRYLLLYSATGDERFLARLDGLGAVFEEGIAAQKNANTLADIWELYRHTVGKVRDAYTIKDADLKRAVAQTQEVSALFDAFILESDKADQSPSLADNLRHLALLRVQQANREVLGESPDDGRLDSLYAEIDRQLDSLPAGDAQASSRNERLKKRWQYLRMAANGGQLYPFNAQIEYLLAHLPAE
ncbi:hypothetical protein D3C76_1277680 [compost metagenome]